jgi:hypothetical protein
MKDYVLNEKPEPASNDIVWAFDLGHPLRLDRGEDRGEVSNPDIQKTAVNTFPQFLHKASLPCRADSSRHSAATAEAQRRRPWRDVAQRRRLIPAEFALPRGRECCACLRRPRSRVLPRGETKTAAGRRRMWRTRQVHKAREPWLAVEHQI